MSPSGLVALEAAEGMIDERCSALPPESVAVASAYGRVLAAEIESPITVPGFDNSSMDGFAVREEDVTTAGANHPVELRLAGESRAGHPAATEVGEYEAMAIATGAVVPPGADAVVRLEDAVTADGRVQITRPVAAGTFIRRTGEDIRSGDVALEVSTEIGAAELGLIAALGIESVSCHRQPRVRILTTGDELLAAGEEPREGTVHDANIHSIAALVREAGAGDVAAESVGDSRAATAAAVERALDADVAVICGGVSVGAHDHVRGALAELGADQAFWGIAVKPGKPTWFGSGAGGAPLVFGLPGNPVSAIVTFTLLVRRAILTLGGHVGHDPPGEMGLLAADAPRDRNRLHAVRCTIQRDGGTLIAQPTGAQGSHLLSSIAGADALAMVPAGEAPLPAGSEVELRLLPRPVHPGGTP